VKNDIIAYADNVTLEKATWDTAFGMYAIFQLNQPVIAQQIANPFKKFTKRRKNRTGTRFSAVFTLSEDDTIYSDDVMLKGWSDGTNGWKLTLYVNADDDGLHPFMRFEKGQEFGLAMVELDDDETVIDQVKREKVEKGPHKQKLSNFAALLCRTPEFYHWLAQTHGVVFCEGDDREAETTDWMYMWLGIKSRSELDSDAAVADQFHADIRRPYAKWTSQKT
jgi:hypothetical protein